MENEEPKMCTTSGRPVETVRSEQTEKTGQHKDYIVLCPDERAKGFVRPYRDAYRHVGEKMCGAYIDPPHIRNNPENTQTLICRKAVGHEGSCGDLWWTLPHAEAEQVHRTKRRGGCGKITTMGRSLAETYARDPKFYGATFCTNCNHHLPVAEFTWYEMDGTEGPIVGS